MRQVEKVTTRGGNSDSERLKVTDWEGSKRRPSHAIQHRASAQPVLEFGLSQLDEVGRPSCSRRIRCGARWLVRWGGREVAGR